MAITLDGSTGIGTPDITSTAAPALVGTNFTSLQSSQLTGALPAIDGSALTGISTTPTTSQVATATAGIAVGIVGSYAFLMEYGTNFPFRTVGSTLAGSGLYYAAATGNPNFPGSGFASGTWRLMGSYSASVTSNDYPASLWLRIS